MTTIKGSTLWIAYAVVYAVGFVVLMYLTRTSPRGWAALSLPFAFPVILVAIGALASRTDADAESGRKSGSTSLVGGGVAGIRREPMRWTTGVAWTMMNPFFVWVYPADTGISSIRLVFVGWWLACAAFTGLLLPRLMKVTRL
jgi:hypothetical protein